jgi:hypothetical protein
MKPGPILVVLGVYLCGLTSAVADIVVPYTVDVGGSLGGPLNGLSARATFRASGSSLTVLLENTSTGLPPAADVSDSLLVSLGINLPGVDIVSGAAAIIGPGSVGLGQWSGRTAGDSVAEQWLWTNDFGGDLMESYRHVISTSNGQGGGTSHRFDGGDPHAVDGPFGGIAAAPPLLAVPANRYAVSNSIEFTLTLTGPISEAELAAAARAAIVEFGSDARYLTAPAPEPGTSALLFIFGAALRRVRRETRC